MKIDCSIFQKIEWNKIGKAFLISLRSLRDTLIWHALTIIFGLLQVFFLIASFWLNQQDAQTYFQSVINDCSLLFFNSAIVVSLIIDYYILTGKQEVSRFEKFCMTLVPCLIIAMTVFIYGQSQHRSPTFSQENFVELQQITLSLSLMYSFGSKYFGFQKEYQK